MKTALKHKFRKQHVSELSKLLVNYGLFLSGIGEQTIYASKASKLAFRWLY